METLTMTSQVSEDGKLFFDMPSRLKGAKVKATFVVETPDTIQRDAKDWPIGNWERVFGSIQDPNFIRYTQGEPDPLPPFDDNPNNEPLDRLGWPIGFFEEFAGCIKDPNFKRYPQGEAEPVPPLE